MPSGGQLNLWVLSTSYLGDKYTSEGSTVFVSDFFLEISSLALNGVRMCNTVFIV